MFHRPHRATTFSAFAEVVLAIVLGATLLTGFVELAIASAKAEAATPIACSDAHHHPLGHRIRWC